MAVSPRKIGPVLTLVFVLAAGGCEHFSEDSREEEQRSLRAQRLARARAQRARQTRRDRLRKRLGARPSTPGTQSRRVTPAGPCTPAQALKTRVSSSLFNDQFGQAVRKVLTPIRADLVELKGTPFQRFTFTVRMHPGEAPRFARRKSRGQLELELRFTPLCQPGAAPGKTQLLRVTLDRAAPGKRRPGTSSSLWPQRTRRGAFRVPVGAPIQLLINPRQATLRKEGKLDATKASPGIWEVRGARFTGRPRLRRLSLATSKLPDSLRQLHLVEVACSKTPDRRCRYLTRRLGRRSLVTPWKTLLKLAAPPSTKDQVRQLHEIDLRLRYPKCGGDARRIPTRLHRHPCYSPKAGALHCLFWRAFNGYGNLPRVTGGGDWFRVRHVLSCPGKKLRVLQLRASYGSKGRYRLDVTDLSPKASRLLAPLRAVTNQRRRRKKRRR